MSPLIFDMKDTSEEAPVSGLAACSPSPEEGQEREGASQAYSIPRSQQPGARSCVLGPPSIPAQSSVSLCNDECHAHMHAHTLMLFMGLQ